MKRSPAAALVILFLAPVFAAAQTAAQSPAPAPTLGPAKRPVRGASAITPEAMKWEATGPMYPSGSRVALLAGNPTRPVAYAVRVRVAEASIDEPHWHATDVQITVLQGVLLLGVGDAFDETKLQKYGPGSFLLIPAGLRHFMSFQPDTEYQMQGIGPLMSHTAKTARPVMIAAPVAPDAQKQKAEFEAAVTAFTQAAQAKDRTALNTTVRQEFDRIARGGGPHALAARDYLNNRIPVELVTRGTGTCPAIGRAGNVGWVVQEVKPGDTVAPALLDPKLEWTSCSSPEFPPRPASASAKSGIVRLTVKLNESGTVVAVNARGGLYPPGVYESAAAAVRTWRTNPPRAKAQAVKTEVSVDIPYSQ